MRCAGPLGYVFQNEVRFFRDQKGAAGHALAFVTPGLPLQDRSTAGIPFAGKTKQHRCMVAGMSRDPLHGGRDGGTWSPAPTDRKGMRK
jgi:hypothetical protein